MKNLSLDDIHIVSFSLMEEIHNFCVKNTIRYSLAYGSLIGAIRHKGFIPWDDDIDIIMPRPDYEIFCQSFTSDKCRCISYENNKDTFIAYARVVDDKCTFVEGSSWCADASKNGVWIDVFPIDARDTDQSFYAKRYRMAQKRYINLFKYRVILRGWDIDNSNKLNLCIKIIDIFPIAKRLIRKITRSKVARIIAIAKALPFGTTEMACQIGCPDNGVKEVIYASDFDHLILTPFENGYFYIISNYDSFLSSVYGNYMELPPLEQRVPKQGNLKFFWREE